MNTVHPTLMKLTDSLDHIYSSLVAEGKSKIPEPVFIEHFLPFFSGKEVENPNTVMQNWVSIAGSPLHEVDVVNEKQEVIFTVPAIMDTGLLNVIKNNSQETLPSIYNRYNIQKDSLIADAGNKLLNELNNNFKQTINSETYINNSNKWVNIIQRYENPTDKKTTSQINQDNDLVYD